MWELMELSVEWQRSAWTAQQRAMTALSDSARTGQANAAAGVALSDAAAANAKAWSRWMRLWTPR